MSSFLKARWEKLLNITYAVEPQLLEAHLPKGLELDRIDGNAFVSLVAFEFNQVKLKGLPIPFHQNFPEINLRFYVNFNGKRGVVFIREFVPRYCVALVANRIYNEPYHSIQMVHSSATENGNLYCQHQFQYRGRTFSIATQSSTQTFLPAESSMEHYFKEHDLGFGVDHSGNSLAYRVDHPIWEIYRDVQVRMDVDFGVLYGEKWNFLKDQKPLNTLLAKGSEVKVFSKMRLSDLG